MALSQDQIAAQMIAQLRVLDPSLSAEVGTPERKIIDTLAQQIAESQIDLNILRGGLDLDSKYGSDLDAFLSLFAFGRQTGSFATGFVTFSRPTASAYNIIIPANTQVMGAASAAGSDTATTATVPVIFQTTQAVTLVAGQTSVAAPIQAVLAGAQANLAANTVTQFANIGSPPLGITSLTNELPTANGSDLETDAELKVRFRNTVFRNLSGTEDQFLALALATQFSTKATVIGPISRYQEYMQVPAVDDSQVEPLETGGNGLPGQWTTTPSNNSYAKYIYTNVPYFVTNGQNGVNIIFYRQDTDFVLNAPPIDAGDTYRESVEGDIPNPSTTPYNPNVTFFNVYTGTDPDVTLPRPNDVVLLEYSYLSAESRNDIVRNITNCVDVYVNGQNPTTADAVIPTPSGTTNLFTANPVDKFYNQNFSRIGFPDLHPTVGHIFTALFWQPLTDVPVQIVVGTNTYFEGTHYWAVEDRTLLGNTVRSRNGIEWDPTAPGMTSGDPEGGPYTGATITSTGLQSITITGYTYDKNIVDLQTAIDGAKQVTTDALAHRASPRYFKLDVTVVYAAGASISSTNLAISSAVANFFDGQYFGSVIQLSDLLVTIRNATGVQNVRWSNDVVSPSDDDSSALNRVTECNVDGTPRGTPPFNTDFALRDSELPSLPVGTVSGDTLAGLIIRPRSQNTFNVV